jgi:hypothetical protein
MSDEPEVAAIVPVFDAGVALRPVMNVASALQQLAEFQEFVKQYLVPEEDYGIIPGTAKPTLFKSGAEKLCDIYGMADDYRMEKEVENWEMVPPLFDYQFKCILTSRRDQRFLGAGFGSCNSYESKYKWRESKRKCPLCGKEAIIKGQEKYGGGWACWKKREGCGAKFLDTDKAITEQKVSREANEDIADLKNTILKMAKKRAKLDAVIAVTRSSGIFTQDMEDRPEAEADSGQGSHAAAQRVLDEKLAKAKAKIAPSAPVAVPTLFYTEPERHNGHYMEFINIREFLALRQDMEDALRLIFSSHKAKKTKDETALVPAGELQGLLEELVGTMGLTVKKLEAPHE